MYDWQAGVNRRLITCAQNEANFAGGVGEDHVLPDIVQLLRDGLSPDEQTLCKRYAQATRTAIYQNMLLL